MFIAGKIFCSNLKRKLRSAGKVEMIHDKRGNGVHKGNSSDKAIRES